jgi:hypothetical protein
VLGQFYEKHICLILKKKNHFLLFDKKKLKNVQKNKIKNIAIVGNQYYTKILHVRTIDS